MPDEDTEFEGLDPAIREQLKRSKELQRENADLKAKAEAAERETAFAKSGVPDNPANRVIAQTYQGESDPASVKAYFESLGVDMNDKVESGPSDEELAAQQRLAQVGAQGGQGGDVSFEDALNNAKTEAEVMDLIRNAPEGATDAAGRRITVPRIE